MPSASYNPRTYGRKSLKRNLEYTRESTPEGKRRKLAPAEEVSTDVEEDEPTPPRARNTRVAARDLSQIFDQLSPSPSPTKSPAKLKERMLSRSRTESSFASGSGSKSSSTSSIGALSRTTSLSQLPASPGSRPEAKPSPVPRPKPVGRTYAGPSRSFLVPIPVSTATMGQLHEELDDEFAARESYTSIRRRWGVDNSEDDPYPYGSPTRSGSNASTPAPSPSKSGKGKGKARPEPTPLANGMMNPLKSITELRNQGESRRFLDEVGYLWEGLDKSCAVGLRRASALEITTKLCESEFARKAKAADFIGPTWELLLSAGAGQDEDKLLDILSVFFAALVSREAASLSDLADRPSSSFTSTLFTILKSSPDPLTCISDPVQLRKLGLSKKDQNLLTTIHTAISSSALFPPSTPPSSALMVSRCLVALPPASLYSTSENIQTLLATLRTHLSPLLASPLSTFITTSAYNDPQIAFTCLYNILSLLDSYLVGAWGESLDDDDAARNQSQVDDAREEWLLDGLVALTVYIEVANSRPSAAKDLSKTRRQCALIILRLIVRLTHSDQTWCAQLTKSEFCFGLILRAILRGHSMRLGQRMVKDNGVKKEEDDSDIEEVESGDKSISDDGLDTLCLALGVLTNLIQLDEEVKDTLREIYISPQCNLTKISCLASCQCPQKQLSALEIVGRVYKELLPTLEAPEVKHEPESENDNGIAEADIVAAGEVRLLLSHLSLLFGLLMQDNEANQRVVIDLLPPTASSGRYRGDAAKVDVLLGQAREFGYIYHEAGVEGDEKESEMESVRRIVKFLEGLRER
ncbi:hypothetical protein FB45DRAFT_926274 [Roridomyces roridus]|uniref:Wings apart-like protein C-terminal domain-containing protein n=1 Tax=Roridomyces roridus TaxID=1738132 RepID=A0AAD7FK68_9AGAR|nr:hypothetical protein FB45DRAFT_926274 [Roridomyces roridus]